MGISGLLSGGKFLAILALVCGIFATAAPMWLITRLELHNKLCWTGSGLWSVDFVWGQDIPEMGLVCRDSAVERSTYDTYCRDQGEEGAGFNDAMCRRTNWAKGLGVAGQVAGLLALLLALDFGSKRHYVSNSAVLGYSSEKIVALALVWSSALAALFNAACFFVMYSSPLFSLSHAQEISKDQSAPFETQNFGCTFQSPLRAENLLEALVKSSPLNCYYGGPSFAMSASALVCWSMASFFFLLMYRDVSRLQAVLREDPDAVVSRATPKPPIRHPILEELLYPRHYSLYGAMQRRLAHRSCANFIVLLLPSLVVATMTIFAVMMLNNGAAVQVFIRISSPAFFPSEWESFLRSRPAHRILYADGNVTHLHATTWSSSALGGGGKPATVELIEEVFDFTMLTSIKNFWDGKAYALALLTAVFCAVWPYVRIAIQLYCFFAPVDEHIRGRALTWLDGLGKWTMVNTFVLCFMGEAFHLQSTIRIPGIFHKSKDLIDVGVEVSLGPRIATYLFVVGVLLSLVVSALFVWVHRKCRDWEELRNAQKSIVRRVHLLMSNGGEPSSGTTGTTTTGTNAGAADASLIMRGYTPGLLPSGGGGAPSYRGPTPPHLTLAGAASGGGEQQRQPMTTTRTAAAAAGISFEAGPPPPGSGGINTTIRLVHRHNTPGDEITEADEDENDRNNGGGDDDDEDDGDASTQGGDAVNATTALLNGLDAHGNDFNNGEDDEATNELNSRVRHLLSEKAILYAHGFGYEALCDRHHNPIPGKKYVYSPLAKTLVWICLGLTMCTTLAGMLEVSCAFTFDGLVGQVIVDAHDRRREYSLMSIGTSIETEMGSVYAGAVFLTGVFFSFAFVAPLLRIAGLCVLWFVPMRPQQQRFWFHLMEVIESYSALDVYFVSILSSTLEIGSLSRVILGQSFPAVETLVDEKFPQFGGLFVVKQELLNGMFLILTGVLFEKFMSLIIVAQTAQSVAERIAEEKLAINRQRGLPGVREEHDMFEELEAHPETWAVLSPAARYTSASGLTNIVYSGLPRFVWHFGIRVGLMTEVDEADYLTGGGGGIGSGLVPRMGGDRAGGASGAPETSYFSLEGV